MFQIVSSALKDEGIDSETIITELEEEEEDQELPFITRDEGYRAYNNFKSFLEQFPGVSSENIRVLRDLYDKIDNDTNFRQPNIEKYFTSLSI